MVGFTSTKGQIWGIDLMIAMTIFLFGIILVYVYAINFNNNSEDILRELNAEAILVSSLILSEGNPESWNIDNVEIPGILSSNRLNQTKLEDFYSLSQNNYPNLKKMLGAKNDFYFSFDGLVVGGELIGGVGKFPDDSSNLIKIERIIVSDNKPVKFTLYIWN